MAWCEPDIRNHLGQLQQEVYKANIGSDHIYYCYDITYVTVYITCFSHKNYGQFSSPYQEETSSIGKRCWFPIVMNCFLNLPFLSVTVFVCTF